MMIMLARPANFLTHFDPRTPQAHHRAALCFGLQIRFDGSPGPGHDQTTLARKMHDSHRGEEGVCVVVNRKGRFDGNAASSSRTCWF